jgi:transcriptional regulator with XRE-family HTH domain
VANQARFFRALGLKIRAQRKKCGYSQEDMISFGFSARHWQQIEKGRPITMTTFLRISVVLKAPLSRLLRGLDKEIERRVPSRLIDIRKFG